MALFRTKSPEELEAEKALRLARLRTKIAKQDLGEVKARARATRVKLHSRREKGGSTGLLSRIFRRHAETHSAGHHAGRCTGACRRGQVMHEHRS